MIMEKLTVIAEMKAKAGKEQDLRQALLSFIEPTHGEEGCLDYDLHESLEEPGHFWFYENWTNVEALKRHLESSHIRGFKDKAENLLAQPVRIIQLRRISRPKQTSS